MIINNLNKLFSRFFYENRFYFMQVRNYHILKSFEKN